jgi:hypothetical protein
VTKILLYTPTQGTPDSASVSLGYHQSAIAFARSGDIEMLDGRLFTDCDLVRARSRAVRMCVESPTATHLLHWDADVVGNRSEVRSALDGMLASGHDFVGAPYPRKRLHWDRVAMAVSQGTVLERQDPEYLQAAAYDYPYRLGGPSGEAEGRAAIEVRNGCVEVEAMGFGFTLTSRRCLERMWQAYAPTLSFGDVLDGQLAWTVALFQLALPPQNEVPPYAIDPLLSEDYSFCARWRALGESVHLYVGNGSPLHHVGSHVFRGVRDGIIMSD